MRYVFAVLVFLAFSLLLVIPGANVQDSILKSFHKITSAPLPPLYKVPIKSQTYTEPPAITAQSAVIIDAKTGVTLFEKEPNIRHLPASTTKLMTALIALEKCSPKNIVNIKSVQKEGTQMGLAPGDNVSVENLLNGLLIASGNDAAYALAYACSDSYPKFIENMNQKAKELGMVNTHFENPAGFDSLGHFSTARDLAKLAKVAVANPLISKIVATQSTVVTDITSSKTYFLENVNKLLGHVEGLEGVKTGQTEGSLEILLTKTTRSGNTIIATVLGSHDRFGESKALIEWVYSSYTWSQVN